MCCEVRQVKKVGSRVGVRRVMPQALTYKWGKSTGMDISAFRGVICVYWRYYLDESP